MSLPLQIGPEVSHIFQDEEISLLLLPKLPPSGRGSQGSGRKLLARSRAGCFAPPATQIDVPATPSASSAPRKRLSLFPVLDHPQSEVPSTVDTGDQGEHHSARDGIGCEGFLGNQSDRAKERAEVARNQGNAKEEIHGNDLNQDGFRTTIYKRKSV